MLLLALSSVALGQTAAPPDAKRPTTTARWQRPNIFITLARPSAAVNFNEASFEDVMNWVRDRAGVNVVVNWGALAAVGVERDTPVTLVAKDLPFSRMLWLILQSAGGPDVRLGYRADPDMLYISTVDDLASKLIVKVYDVQDLIMNIPSAANFESVRTRELVTSNGANGARVVDVVQSGTRFFDEGDDDRGIDEQETETDVTLRQLIDVITGTIDPDSWQVNGGPGVIRSYRGQIVVRNSHFVHQKLGGWLTKP